jgi:hypothetical protein
VESLCLDLSDEQNCRRAVAGAGEVYQLAADMGGMGFIERFRVACLRSILINTHMIESAYRAGCERYFYSSSACVYNTDLQKDPRVKALKESDAYPAMAERGYGWEKLVSEMFCQEYWAERGMKTFIARFHNVYGPWGTWDGGRENAGRAEPKIIKTVDDGTNAIEIWGDGTRTRAYGRSTTASRDRPITTPLAHPLRSASGRNRARVDQQARLDHRGERSPSPAELRPDRPAEVSTAATPTTGSSGRSSAQSPRRRSRTAV